MKQLHILTRVSAFILAVIFVIGMAAGCANSAGPEEPIDTRTASTATSSKTTVRATEAPEPDTEPWDTAEFTTAPTAEPNKVTDPSTEPVHETTSQIVETSKPTETSAPAETEHIHSFDSKVIAPTCTEKGYTVYTCTVCGDSYIGNETPAIGHSYQDTVMAPTCTAEGYTLHVCAVCGDSYSDSITPAKGHTWGQWTTTAEPAYTSEGTEDRVCSVCGAVESRQIPRLEMSVSEMALEVFRLVNIEREKAGLAPLQYATAYQPAAAIRVKEIQEVFEHTRPDGRVCFTVLEDLSLNDFSFAGENIAYGYTTPEAVLEGWMNSEGHRANILSTSFTSIAIGFENNYWVQIFIG